MRASTPFIEHLTECTLAATGVGMWEHRVVEGMVYFDATVAAIYGLTAEEGREGVSIGRMTEKIPPDDRLRALEKRAQKMRLGGLFVNEYRVMPSPDTIRWVLARGRYEKDATTGRPIRARGIMIDVTESKVDGFNEGQAFFAGGDDHLERATTLERVAGHALDARRAIDDLSVSEQSTLRPLVDALLLGVGRELAMRPKGSSGTDRGTGDFE